MKENDEEENIIKEIEDDKTFNKLKEIQMLLIKESSLKGLCKKNKYNNI